MAKISFAVAILALFAAASGAKAKPKTYRQSCVDNRGQTQTEGSVWYEGVNGCLKLTCRSGVAIGEDNCSCRYPDGTTGHSGDVWYSIPTCQSCRCNSGAIACDTLLNCVLPPTSTAVPPTATATTCVGPDNLVMNVGDMYIEGCMNCTCTATGLACYGMVDCPVTTPSADVSDGECFMGWLGFVDSLVSDTFVPNGHVFTETCNTCTCKDGVFICEYTCVDGGTYTPEGTQEPDDEAAAYDCDVGIGIILNGDSWTNDCGASCLCVSGNMNCQDCPVTSSQISTVIVQPQTVTVTAEPTPTATAVQYVCVDNKGGTVENGQSYSPDKCTNCTCINGVFTCLKTCERDCTTEKGKVVSHGSQFLDTCLSCKCSDATLTCTNTCEGKVCKVPNSKKTVARGKTVTIDSCIKCKCTSTVLLQCRDYCDTTTPCICDGRMLRSGKSRTTNCKKCTCNGGKLSCKKVC